MEGSGLSIKVSAVLITREAEWPRDARVDFDFDEVLVGTKSPNVFRRFELAMTARNDVVYVQDDDCSIDIEQLWRKYDGRLTNAQTPEHQRVYGGTGMTLIGWGAFFPKRLIDFSRWIARYGKVDQMECDRIFTFLAQPHNTIVMPIRQFTRPVRMCNQPGHYQVRDRLLTMLKEL